jgi:hypothetical protein
MTKQPLSETGWRRMTFLAFGLYLAAQALPPFHARRGDAGANSAPGIMMTYLSFVGLVYNGESLGRAPGLDQSHLLTLKLTCVMGAAANVLIVVGSVSAWCRKYVFSFYVATAAALLAVLVLFPIGIWRDPLAIHMGYLCWAGSAGLLAYASWRLAATRKAAKEQAEL